MSELRRFVATSDHPIARLGRAAYLAVRDFTLPAPRIIVRPALWMFLAARQVYYFLFRVLVCEPLFKAYCKQYGRGVRTDVYIHYIEGKGDIVLGDLVRVDGKCSFGFATQFSARPMLVVGDSTVIGHDCRFTIGKQITIGRDCLIASGCWLFDSSGHPADPEARRAGKPPAPEEVRPIVVEDNVWIGGRSVIFPGVRIGEGSIVSANSVVRTNVRPYTVVAGNPARKVADLPRPGSAAGVPIPSAGGAGAPRPAVACLHPATMGENR